MWVREIERRIGRGEAVQCDRGDTKTFAGLTELRRKDPVEVDKERAREGAGPVTVGIDLGHIRCRANRRARFLDATEHRHPLPCGRIAPPKTAAIVPPLIWVKRRATPVG